MTMKQPKANLAARQNQVWADDLAKASTPDPALPLPSPGAEPTRYICDTCKQESPIACCTNKECSRHGRDNDYLKDDAAASPGAGEAAREERPRAGGVRGDVVTVPTYVGGAYTYRHDGGGWLVYGSDGFRGSLVSHRGDSVWLIAAFAEALAALSREQAARAEVESELARVRETAHRHSLKIDSLVDHAATAQREAAALREAARPALGYIDRAALRAASYGEQDDEAISIADALRAALGREP
jgi:hypothetical protein